MRRLLKHLIPGALLRYVHEKRRWRWFRGVYTSWDDAASKSKGYDDRAILDRAVQATRKVQRGLASWERDGFAFSDRETHVPLINALRRVSTCHGSSLEVIDYGGGLGSTWRQHQDLLRTLGVRHWRVVEQQHFVKAGVEFESDVLKFYESLEKALAAGSCSVIICSGVLQYLKFPYAIVEQSTCAKIGHIIIDRIPFSVDGCERIVVQHTPAILGGGSYPCWLMSRQRMLTMMKDSYELIVEWPGFDQLDPDIVQYRGMLFRMRKPG